MSTTQRIRLHNTKDDGIAEETRPIIAVMRALKKKRSTLFDCIIIHYVVHYYQVYNVQSISRVVSFYRDGRTSVCNLFIFSKRETPRDRGVKKILIIYTRRDDLFS